MRETETFGRIAELDLPPLEYYKLVSDLNLLLQQELSQRLNEHAGDIGNTVTFVTPGSDGRLEKGSRMSPLEVIALTDTDLNDELYQQELVGIFDDVSPIAIAKIIEMKKPSSSLVKTYNDRSQPGRIADGRFIYGSKDKAHESKVKLGHEIIGLRSKGVARIANLKRDARQATEQGYNNFMGDNAIHFDLESGQVHYDPNKFQLSFKIGPLRLVQNTILLEEVKHTRRENDPDFISTLDTNIVQRLQQLSDDHLTNLLRESVDEVSEHYAYFLRLYHISERAYSEKGQTQVQLEPNTIAEVSKRLQALSEIMERFEIKKQI